MYTICVLLSKMCGKVWKSVHSFYMKLTNCFAAMNQNWRISQVLTSNYIRRNMSNVSPFYTRNGLIWSIHLYEDSFTMPTCNTILFQPSIYIYEYGSPVCEQEWVQSIFIWLLPKFNPRRIYKEILTEITARLPWRISQAINEIDSLISIVILYIDGIYTQVYIYINGALPYKFIMRHKHLEYGSMKVFQDVWARTIFIPFISKRFNIFHRSM